jgi:hypothetical protein
MPRRVQIHKTFLRAVYQDYFGRFSIHFFWQYTIVDIASKNESKIDSKEPEIDRNLLTDTL